MNRVEIKGGLTRDADIRQVGSGLMVQFTVAVNGTRYDRESQSQVVKTIFVTCQAWAAVAEDIANSGGLDRGDEVHVVGELDQYKKDDADKPSTRVTVYQWTLLRGGRVRQAQQQQWPGTAPGSGAPPW